MAGRGTDIKLSPESIAAGGLYILGTERHESRRIDNQLRGRSGRQGDPGESRFYISLEDDLIRIFAGDNLKRQMHRVGMKEDEVIESRFVSRIIENAQERVEKQNFEYRKHLLEYDDVLNQQRMVVYAFRRQALQSSEDITAIVRDIIADAVSDTIEQVMANAEGGFTAATREAIITQLCSMTHLNAELFAGVNTANSETFTSDAINALLLAYDELLNAADEERLSHIHRWLLLESIDQAWKQHMLNLDQLKEGIGLRGWGQKNPLNEYKKEAFYLFESMMRSAKADIAHHIFRTSLEHFDEQALERRREKELQSLNLQGAHAPTASDDTSVDAYQRTQGGGTVVRSEEKVSRNAECTCGSGKKYKKCCGN
jgi:preprotein translocase subunit SecA